MLLAVSCANVMGALPLIVSEVSALAGPKLNVPVAVSPVLVGVVPKLKSLSFTCASVPPTVPSVKSANVITSFTGVMLITAFALTEGAPVLSVTINGMVTVPLKFGTGVNLRVAASSGVKTCPAKTGLPLAKVSTPWLASGKVGTVTLAIVPSTSVPVRLSVAGVSSSTVVLNGVATGGSFTGVMLNVSVEVSVPPAPSETV